VSPGLTVTPMTQGDIGVPAEKRDEAARTQLSLIPMKRFLDAEEIANVMLFLGSDESSPFTGASWFLMGASRKCDSESLMETHGLKVEFPTGAERRWHRNPCQSLRR
jgi:hypothetical protein